MKIVHEVLGSGFQPDVLVGISKGGVVLTSLISDMLGVPTDLMQLSHWGFGRSRDDVIIKYGPSIDPRGLRVLLIDDVSDTGSTLSIARDLLVRLGAREVRTAVLDYKALSSKYVPDYYAYRWTRWVYIIYPWESFEAFRNVDVNDARVIFTNHELIKMRELMRP